MSSTTPSFADLGLMPELVHTLTKNDVIAPFPIQAATIPDAIAGRDILGRGETGSGKTLAFGLAVIALTAAAEPARSYKPRALIMTPTRELAIQVKDSLEPYAHAVGRLDPPRCRWPAVRQADRRPAQGRGHPGRHPGPADRPGRARFLRPVRGGNRRPRRGRPDGRHGLPARRHRADGQDPARRPAPVVLGDAGQGRADAGPPVPHRPGRALGGPDHRVHQHHDAPRAAHRAEAEVHDHGRDRGPAWPHDPVRPHPEGRRPGDQPAARGRRAGRGAARRPVPEPPQPGHRRVPLRPLPRPGRHRRRGPGHPRRRRHAGPARRPAGRPQGLPAPRRTHRPRRRSPAPSSRSRCPTSAAPSLGCSSRPASARSARCMRVPRTSCSRTSPAPAVRPASPSSSPPRRGRPAPAHGGRAAAHGTPRRAAPGIRTGRATAQPAGAAPVPPDRCGRWSPMCAAPRTPTSTFSRCASRSATERARPPTWPRKGWCNTGETSTARPRNHPSVRSRQAVRHHGGTATCSLRADRPCRVEGGMDVLERRRGPGLHQGRTTSSSSTSDSATCRASCSTSTCRPPVFDEEFFDEGLMFDGSSIRGFQAIHESDMKLIPDPTTAYVDPFRAEKTLAMNFSIRDPFTDEPYSRDPRNIAAKAEAYLKGTGHRRHRLLRRRRRSSTSSTTCGSRPSRTPATTTSTPSRAPGTPARVEEGGNRGYKTRYKGGYFPVPPVDHFADLRDEMVAGARRRSASRSSARTTRSAPPARPRSTTSSTRCCTPADHLMLFKYVIKNVAWAHGKTATFMPKPLFGDNGSGMHCHQSLWKDGAPLFYDELGYARPVRHGPLVHRRPAGARPVAAGVHQPDGELLPPPGARASRRRSTWSTRQRNRSACIRIPITGNNPKAKRIEFRVPDPSCNPYLAFSAMLMAGLDGIKNKIEPRDPVDKDLYELPPDEARRHPAGARLAAGGARRARGRPRVPDSRATSSPPT